VSIDWQKVRRVLVIRLRSIGDTVLATPSLIALKRFLPHADVDILLEDWVVPLLEGHDSIDNVLTAGKTTAERIKTARAIRSRRYDVVFNLHGGSTSAFFVATSGARHRVGYAGYRYAFVYNHRLSSSSDFWKREHTHSAEQQLALLGLVGVPVRDRPRSHLTIRTGCISGLAVPEPFALIHPTAATETKTWPVESFARIVEYLYDKGLRPVAVGTMVEEPILESLKAEARTPITTFFNLSLPQITALASQAKIFIGNDSGIAHIAAAVETPSVVIFGSSNRHHWYPWTDGPNEIVFHEFHCQPCPGYECNEYGDARCIRSVRVEAVIAAIERVL